MSVLLQSVKSHPRPYVWLVLVAIVPIAILGLISVVLDPIGMTKMDEIYKGGGTAASFGGILWSAYKFCLKDLLAEIEKGVQVRQDFGPDIQHYQDNQAIASALQGTWKYEGKVVTAPGSPPAKARGEVHITKSTYRLLMDGDWQDDQGEKVGYWTAKQVFLDNRQLVYLFEVTDPEQPGSTVNGLGQVIIHRDGEKPPSELVGKWSVLGRPAGGSVTFRR